MTEALTLQRSQARGAAGSLWEDLFPAAWWRAVLSSPSVTLTVDADDAEVRLMAADGTRTALRSRARVRGRWSVRVPLHGADWLWVEGQTQRVEWTTEESPEVPQVTAVVPTYGRPADVLEQSRSLLASELVGRVIVIDQEGSIPQDPHFGELRERAGDRLVLLTQDNLGGSGGYARGMLESLRWPQDAVFLGDDDARIDPEGLRRMAVYQALAAARGRRCLMATGMRSAEEPRMLVSLAERVDPRSFQWLPADGLADPVDLQASDGAALRERLRLRRPADYAGWWGALLPPGTVADLGFPAPYFLKWDDAEYGLRARRRGYDVAALPGVAVRHPTWAAKETSAGWASLLMHRNRLATAAAYGAGRGVLVDSLAHQVKHVLSLQYPVAVLWLSAAQRVLDGPQAWLGSDLRGARAAAQQVLDHIPQPAPPRRAGAPARGPRLLRALLGLWRAVPAPAHVVHIPAHDFTWRDGLGADGVRLHRRHGEPGTLDRDPVLARRLLRDTVRTHVRLAIAWPRLRRDYRSALAGVTTQRYWTRTIEGPQGR